jgi:CubicO group peptidase (beta-lactamase class C family)
MPEQRNPYIFRGLLLLGTLASLYFVPWELLWIRLTPLPASVQEQVEDAVDYGFAGIIVYVDRAGAPPKHYAAGYHDRDARTPANPHALFKIASIEKLYDAVATVKLVSSGRLDLDSTVADYLPELQGRIEHADKITLAMLLRHRSGIPNFTDTPGYWTDPPADSEEALARVLDRPADFAPGTDYAYSNTNYLLLSLITERVLGYSQFRYTEEVILEPLGLERTHESIHAIDTAELMSGYYVGVEEDIKMADYGSMVATAEDVGRFLRALNDGSLFARGERERYASLYEFGHTGLVAGYQSIARYHPDIDAVIVQFTNTTDFGGNEWAISETVYGRILRIVKRREPGDFGGDNNLLH